MSFHFLEGETVGQSTLALRKTFLQRALYLFLHFPCFKSCSAFYPGWISVEGPNVVLYCTKLLVNPQWTQFLGVVQCPTWWLKLNIWNEAFGDPAVACHNLFAFSVQCTPCILFMHIQEFKKATGHKLCLYYKDQ